MHAIGLRSMAMRTTLSVVMVAIALAAPASASAVTLSPAGEHRAGTVLTATHGYSKGQAWGPPGEQVSDTPSLWWFACEDGSLPATTPHGEGYAVESSGGCVLIMGAPNGPAATTAAIPEGVAGRLIRVLEVVRVDRNGYSGPSGWVPPRDSYFTTNVSTEIVRVGSAAPAPTVRVSHRTIRLRALTEGRLKVTTTCKTGCLSHANITMSAREAKRLLGRNSLVNLISGMGVRIPLGGGTMVETLSMKGPKTIAGFRKALVKVKNRSVKLQVQTIVGGTELLPGSKADVFTSTLTLRL